MSSVSSRRTTHLPALSAANTNLTSPHDSVRLLEANSWPSVGRGTVWPPMSPSVIKQGLLLQRTAKITISDMKLCASLQSKIIRVAIRISLVDSLCNN